MLLTQTAEYALRAMAALATLEPGASLRAPDLAENTGIPAHYVSKVMRKLVLAKLVRAQKGHGGGFQLARAASQIRFADILAAADYSLAPNQCAFGWGQCDLQHPCPLHPAWTRLNESFQHWSRETTLAEVAVPRRVLEQDLAPRRRAAASSPRRRRR